ncbi:14_t:CDS:2, partial [Funneliformis mosseae]
RGSRNQSNKTQRIETRQYKKRVNIGCSQNGIYSINVNATILEVGFLEVVGNTLYTDIKKLSEDTEKCLSSHIELLSIIKRKFTFYVMHQTNGGLHVVDVLTEFSIPSTKDQLYVLKEIIENVYLFKKIIPLTKTHVGISESPVNTSPFKASRIYDALKILNNISVVNQIMKNTV